MIVIPELELVKYISDGITALKIDYDNASNKDDSVLATLFKGVTYEKLDFYEQAVTLFVTNQRNTESTSNRKITVRSYYDRTIRSSPAIHITAPNENEEQPSIGSGFGEFSSEINDNLTMRENRRKTYKSRNAVVFTSDNHVETQIMYYTVRSLLQSIFDTYSLTSHQNPIMSGNELRMDDNTAPKHLYVRALIIDSFTEMNVPNIFYSENFTNLIFPRSNSFEGGHLGDEKLTINT